MIDNILGGILIALISGMVGKALGSYNRIKICECDRRQKDCQRLLIEKIDHLRDEIEKLTKIVDNKILNL